MAKILVAEDDREVRELIIFTLRFAGYEMLAAVDGEECYLFAKQHRPDLILMDARMPKLNGYEACKLLKADKVTASIPVVFLTAHGLEAEVQAGLNAGCDDYILKPISPDRLTEKVKLYLQKRRK